MDRKAQPDTESPSHQRPPFADPLAGRVDPTAPGAPHEPGGEDYNQSKARPVDHGDDPTLDEDGSPR